MCWSFGSNSEGQLGTGRGGGEWSSTPVPWEGVAGGVTRYRGLLIGQMSKSSTKDSPNQAPFKQACSRGGSLSGSQVILASDWLIVSNSVPHWSVLRAQSGAGGATRRASWAWARMGRKRCLHPPCFPSVIRSQ